MRRRARFGTLALAHDDRVIVEAMNLDWRIGRSGAVGRPMNPGHVQASSHNETPQISDDGRAEYVPNRRDRRSEEVAAPGGNNPLSWGRYRKIPSRSGYDEISRLAGTLANDQVESSGLGESFRIRPVGLKQFK